MENIFKKMREAYEEGQTTEKTEEKLQYLILQQRYNNLNKFLEKQETKYGMACGDVEELKDLLFYYNDLKEINFIGTDMYANALFFKHTVPYLYRSVGKDTDKLRVFGDLKVKGNEHVKKIFEKCVEQIQKGGGGKLFSYTKCFGKMLYKYITLQREDSNVTIEIRKNAVINAILEDEKESKFISIQQYMRKNANNTEENGLPYFAIDMSNARDNKVKCLKYWIIEFLGEMEWNIYNDIVDPIGDAEVVLNFTHDSLKKGEFTHDSQEEDVIRKELNRDEFCVLLYKYFEEYASKISCEKDFKNYIGETLKTLGEFRGGALQTYYYMIMIVGELLESKDSIDIDKDKIKKILKNIDIDIDIDKDKIKKILEDIDKDKIKKILGNIVWENEKKYMPKRREEKESAYNIDPMGVYHGDNAEVYSKEWKDILFNAVENKYTHSNYSAWKDPE